MYAGTHIGRYEIRSKIGEGGMGEVYEALDSELDRNVAIKILPFEFTEDEDRRSRFRQEAKVVSALNHPNILTIYEIGENEHGSYLATELVEGRTLREVLKSESLTLPRILRIIEQTANALTAAHQAHIVHRDIKPENIMVRPDSIVKVLDFGLAKSKLTLAGDNADNKTIPGTVMGSARYMSPEQARGLEVDERTDIWSLGVVLYEMLIGNVPFAGETTADTIAAVVYKEPVPLTEFLPNVPPELNRIVRKALQKDREERYQSVKDLALDIKDLLYAIEHSNSGERAGYVISNPSFSESPTMIHRTVSSNHPTDPNTALTSVYSAKVSAPHRSGRRTVFASFAAIAIFAVIGSVFYSWLAEPAGLAEAAFQRPQISRINTDGRVMMPAISADGKYVAYVSGEVGSRSLVVRQVATDSTITLLPPTNQNLQSVSFSPTGDHVYYTLMSSDAGISTLFQVPTLGGTPRRLIEDVDSPVTFSPDGKQFAFVRHIPKTNEDTIVVVSAETLEQQLLLNSETTGYDFFVPRLAWSPDGRTILTGAGLRQSGFITRTDVVEVALDSREIRPIKMREFFTAANFAWLADGSGFVFTGRVDQNDAAQIWLANYPSGEMHKVTNDVNDYVDLGIAADGRTIVTTKGDAMGSIWKHTPADRSSLQLTSDSKSIEGKAGIVQRDDGSIVFTRHDGKETDLWVADADGKNGRVLLQEAGYAVDPVVTPDGRYIIYNLQKDRRSRIWRARADGSNPVALTEDNADLADFSPQVTADGRFVIFQRRASGDERFRLMKVPIEGGPAELFYEDADRGVFNPRISPDGKKIAFVSYDLATFAKQLNIGALNGSTLEKLTATIEHSLINGFTWSPDSKDLTILTNRNGAMNLWRQPINGSPAVPITDFKSGRIFNFQWSRNGKDLLIARGTVNTDLILIRDSGRPAVTEEVASRRSGIIPDIFYWIRSASTRGRNEFGNTRY
ncbi:MAG: protein kinase [Pyrinomonadaceae bacterium]|nr:protein kinase [Pyrinomonadaceae bacterium]